MPQIEFTLYPEEVKRAYDWYERHANKKHRPRGEPPGACSWRLTPTSIGTVLRYCCWCGKEKDVTSYDKW